jgi:hypothetical protein
MGRCLAVSLRVLGVLPAKGPFDMVSLRLSEREYNARLGFVVANPNFKGSGPQPGKPPKLPDPDNPPGSEALWVPALLKEQAAERIELVLAT